MYIYICIVWQALCILYGKLFKLINVSPHHLVCCHVNHKSWRLYQNTHATLRSNQNAVFHELFSLLVFFFGFLLLYPNICLLLCIFPCARRSIHILPTVMRASEKPSKHKAAWQKSLLSSHPFHWDHGTVWLKGILLLRRPFLMLPCASKKAFCCSVLRRPVVMLLLWYLWTVFIEFQFEMAIVSYSIT